MPKGILWVSSRLQSPTTLTPQKFCTWYENTHIPEVLALSGIPSAARYEALQPSPFATPDSNPAWSDAAPWLTIYEMPDLDFRKTEEFRRLDGQSRPVEELLEGVFRQARFDTRFYEERMVFEPRRASSSLGSKGPSKMLISAALQPAEGQEDDFEAWYREEHLKLLAECKGYRRTRRYEVVNATVLDRFRRVEVGGELEVPKFLALHEFDQDGDGDGLDMEGLARASTTEWSRKVMGSLKLEEVGWYRLKRVY